MDPLITPSEIKNLSNDLVFIDTREPGDYNAGHIPGAINVREIFTHISLSDKNGLKSLVDKFSRIFGDAGLSGEEHAIIYEDAMHGGNGQSSRGYFLLKYLGYDKVSVLNGGFRAWTDSGLPISKEVEHALPKKFPVNVNHSIMLTKEQMLEKINDKKTIFLDVRDSDEWHGKYSSPSGKDLDLRPGRIPGSVWMEWRSLIDTKKNIPIFRSTNEIKEICHKAGIDVESDIYIYCFKGSRAASTYLAMKNAGFNNVKNYFASWNEWARDIANPMDLRNLPTLNEGEKATNSSEVADSVI
jgi:thiosulfate/3-mercaptopyruvate sulfurtransferase